METKETKREYLTSEELQMLYESHCDYPVLKAASLFSCLTGLRLSDILQLQWSHIQDYRQGGKCIRIKTEKTDTEALIPISDQALRLCGEPGEGKIFKGLDRNLVNSRLKAWVKSAGIYKYITFHCFRHTFAMQLLDKGVDIPTIAFFLGHKFLGSSLTYLHCTKEHLEKVIAKLER